MELSVLKSLRGIAPAILFSVLFAPLAPLLPSIPLKLPMPTEWGFLSAGAVIFAFIYATLPLREISNSEFHRRVRSNIDSRLWAIARGALPQPQGWTNREAMQVFYNLIDNDESLKTKTKNIYANGFLWTTAADLRFIGFCSLLIHLGYLLAMPNNLSVLGGIVLNLVALVLSYIMSETTTKKHISLGNEQLDYIRVNLKVKLEEKLNLLGL